MNFIADVGAILSGIGVDRRTIETIQGILHTNQEVLHDGRPKTSTAGAFGGSGAGLDMDTQTATAHDHVIEALQEMVKGLGIYRDNLGAFMDGLEETDADRQAAFGQVQHNVQSAGHYLNHHDFHDHKDGA